MRSKAGRRASSPGCRRLPVQVAAFTQGSLCAGPHPKSFAKISSQQPNEAASVGILLLYILQAKQLRPGMMGPRPNSLRWM